MFGIGSTELLLILLVALIVLGPKSLAAFSRKFGKYVGEFRRASTEFQRTLNMEAMREEAKETEEKKAKSILDKEAAKANLEKSPQSAPTEEELRLHGIPEDSPLARALTRAREQAQSAEKEAEKAEKLAENLLEKKDASNRDGHENRK